MTGGILQLVAKGLDDVYLTYEPKITWFRCIYRRYTNYSKMEVKQNFQKLMKPGQESRCRIKKLADLVNRIFLCIEIPQVDVLYKKFTYKLLDSILEQVGININTLYNTIYQLNVNYSDQVDKYFYDNYLNI